MQARVFCTLLAAGLALGAPARAQQSNLPPELLSPPALIGATPPAAAPPTPAAQATPAASPAAPNPPPASPPPANPPTESPAPEAAFPAPAGRAPAPPPSAAPAPHPAGEAQNQVHLSALYSSAQNFPIRDGLHWRIFDARADGEGGHALVAESSEATPNFALPDGDYVAHVACGLAGVAKPFTLHGAPLADKLTLNAGALTVVGKLADAPLPAARLNMMLYLPQNDDPEAKLLIAHLKAGAAQCLPEGNYHIVSRLLDPTPGATAPTNITVTADVRVQAGKVTTASLRHRAANMTLKLVNAPGGEALANTSFSILTPGGDVIREMIGAFPSILLAEGEYVAIARHDNQTFQANFKVADGQDRDVEIYAHPAP